MVYITGDMHGDQNRFNTKEIKQLQPGDTLIICGDFGFIWNGSKKERKLYSDFMKKLGNEVSEETILQAALLAAQNSKAANGANVAVDYTPVKFVKKPNGAKAGMVIYTTNKTVYVTPKGEF